MDIHAHHLRAALAAAVLALAILVPAAAANAKAKTLKCNSADLRYPFMPGGPKTFGVFHLKITGGSCATAHRVAKDWMKKFEGNLRHGSDKRPRQIDGFSFKEVPVHEAQTFGEQGTKGATTIRFDYVIPNG